MGGAPGTAQVPPLVPSSPDRITAAPMRGSKQHELDATRAAVLPPSECPTTPTSLMATCPRTAGGSALPSAERFAMRNETSRAWLSMSFWVTGPGGDVLDNGKSGAATTKPCAA